jgi:large subunit ribosomal protein L18
MQINVDNRKTCYVSYLIGNQLAYLSRKKNIKKIVFDRGRYLYHGRVQAVADGARAGGLDF